MNILERSAAFVQSLIDLDRRSAMDWRECPHCGSLNTIRHGHYRKHPSSMEGQLEVSVQRHLCRDCDRTYSETTSEDIYKSRYTRAVHRFCVDCTIHDGISLRHVAEMARSLIGKQEHYLHWHLGKARDPDKRECLLSHTSVQRWCVRAGGKARESVKDHLKGIACSGEMGTDGLWTRLRQGLRRVGLILIDYQSGLIFPPVVTEGEERASFWGKLFDRAEEAGLDPDRVNGVSSDGSHGLLSYLADKLPWVHQQRCVWHLWRNAGRRMAKQIAVAVKEMAEEEAKEMRAQLRDELGHLLHGFFDAMSYEQGEQALAEREAHSCGKALVEWLRPLQDAIFMHLLPCHQGLTRVSPEWYWRDFRQRISRGRNHGSEQQFEQALLVWAIYRNFTPAQRRYEKKRHYRHPGQSPLEVAGAPPGTLSYLDALGV